MDKQVHVVAAVFMSAEGQVLACRRTLGRAAGGRWEFPGGKVEPGEKPENALSREIEEELATDIEVLDLIDRSTTIVGPNAIDLACYRVQALDELPTSSTDHDELRWLEPRELAALDWAEPDLPAVARLIADIGARSRT